MLTFLHSTSIESISFLEIITASVDVDLESRNTKPPGYN